MEAFLNNKNTFSGGICVLWTHFFICGSAVHKNLFFQVIADFDHSVVRRGIIDFLYASVWICSSELCHRTLILIQVGFRYPWWHWRLLKDVRVPESVNWQQGQLHDESILGWSVQIWFALQSTCWQGTREHWSGCLHVGCQRAEPRIIHYWKKCA